MNPVHFLKPSLLTGLALAAMPIFVVTASAQTRCDAPSNVADRRACEAAREGPEALRRFVWRTQGIYGLQFGDYMTAEDIDRYHVRQAAKERIEPSRDLAKAPDAR
jgi:hypothetical protein